MNILCINPGGTSTRVAVFAEDKLTFAENLTHSAEELERFESVQAQLPYRLDLVERELAANGVDLAALDVIMGRGGALRPMEGGIYHISEDMLEDCRKSVYAEHPSNLGCQMALHFATRLDRPCFIVDPPLIDEFDDMARISGWPELERKSAFHPLNQKMVARFMAAELKRPLEELNLITVHLGSGISVTPHRNGRCTDNNFGSGGDGPFSPERCGRIPSLALLEYITAGYESGAERDPKAWGKLYGKKSGLVSYLGTNDLLKIEKAALPQMDGASPHSRQGSPAAGEGAQTALLAQAKDALDAMIHLVAKETAAYAAILDWKVDGIGLTGAIAKSDYVCARLKAALEFIAPVSRYAGEFEMEALAEGGRMAMTRPELVKTYQRQGAANER